MNDEREPSEEIVHRPEEATPLQREVKKGVGSAIVTVVSLALILRGVAWFLGPGPSEAGDGVAPAVGLEIARYLGGGACVVAGLLLPRWASRWAAPGPPPD